VGKLFLALGAGAVASPEPPYERFSAHTATTPAQLESEVARVRRRGVAENRDEWIPGLTVLAAPVSTGDRMHAAIAVAAPSLRFEARAAEAITEKLLAAAERIAARLEGKAR